MTDLPRPFLGRLLLKVQLEEKMDYKVGEDLNARARAAGLILPDQDKSRVPCRKGVIVDKAPDAFGKFFQDSYGTDHELPEIGDTVMFIPNQQYNLDLKGEYCIISDNHIVAIDKRKEV